MKYVDVHAHMNEEIFDKDRKQILNECAKKGITIIDCAGKPEGNRKLLKLIEHYKNLRACIGIYPIQTSEMSDTEFSNELKFIEENKDKIVGIGEVGLDFYWIKDEHKRKLQMDRFNEIIWLANKLKLPLNVHSRAAETETIAMLSKSAHVPILLHSFDEVELAKHAAKEGFYIGIAPIVMRSNKQKRLVESVPIDKLLTETDSPYRGPSQERNDPRNILLVVEKIAEIKKLEVETVQMQLLENAKRIFKLD